MTIIFIFFDNTILRYKLHSILPPFDSLTSTQPMFLGKIQLCMSGQENLWWNFYFYFWFFVKSGIHHRRAWPDSRDTGIQPFASLKQCQLYLHSTSNTTKIIFHATFYFISGGTNSNFHFLPPFRW